MSFDGLMKALEERHKSIWAPLRRHAGSFNLIISMQVFQNASFIVSFFKKIKQLATFFVLNQALPKQEERVHLLMQINPHLMLW